MGLEYLGHIVGSGIVAVPRMRVTAMSEFQQPVTKKNMRAFLGSVGYYRKFIPHFSRYSSVLTPATCHDAPGKVVWSPKMLEAFSHLKSVLCSVCVLNIPGPEDIFVLQTDTSAGGVGAVLNVVRYDKIVYRRGVANANADGLLWRTPRTGARSACGGVMA